MIYFRSTSESDGYRQSSRSTTQATAKKWLAGIVAGLLLGYSARLAFGCNVGGYFSGISKESIDKVRAAFEERYGKGSLK